MKTRLYITFPIQNASNFIESFKTYDKIDMSNFAS